MANGTSTKLLLSLCTFSKIIAKSYVVYGANLAEGFIDKCCFYKSNTNCYNSKSVTSASVNFTTSLGYYGCCPIWWSSSKFSSLHNNNTYGRVIGSPVCYYLINVPGNRDDTNCFFNGAHCFGAPPVYLFNSVRNSIMSRFNFINNSDSYGYFNLAYSALKILRNSVIVFQTSTPKVIYFTTDKYFLSMESCYLVTTGRINSETQLTMKANRVVKSASTHRPFFENGEFKECMKVSAFFTHKASLESFIVLLQAHICLNSAQFI